MIALLLAASALCQDGDLPEAGAGDAAEANYRRFAEQAAQLPPDEEAAAWEDFLARHPDTPWRDRIQLRIDTLIGQLFDEELVDKVAPPAKEREVRLTPTLLLANIDPRTRIHGGVELGLPNHQNLILGYEHAVAPTFSVQAQVRQRPTGWSLEAGPHVALVKSADAGFVLTFLGDVRYNATPGFPALRPQLGLGKRFGERVEFLVQAGTDYEIREAGGATWIGGAHLGFRASKGVSLFGEGRAMAAYPQWPGGMFHFHTVSAGLRFLLARGGRADAADAHIGGWVALYRTYWDYAQGAATVRTNVFLDDL